MTTTQKVLLFGGGAALLFGLFSRAQAAGNLIFYPDRVSNIDISGGKPVLTAKVLVQNVGNTPLTLYSIAGNLFSNGYMIGNGKNFNGLTVPANSQVLLPIAFELSWFNIVQDLLNAFNGNGFKQAIEWDATINIAGLPVQQQKIKFTVG